MHDQLQQLREHIQHKSGFVDRLYKEVGQVIVGQKNMVERILIGLLCRGHILLEGVPGLAKTMTIQTVSDAIKTEFKRIQFTPDLLPADLTGTQVYNQHTGDFFVKKGPLFTNLVLADEINRAPAKVQAALLEAMQERQITIGEETFRLEEPFLVLATQNPIEQEGTYPLPEAQMDRFLLKVKVDYPTKDEEKEIMRRQARQERVVITPQITPEELVEAQKLLKEIYIAEELEAYIVDVIYATRRPEAYGLKELNDLIQYGASPRGTIALNMAARAHAFLNHEGWVRPDNIKAMAMDVLRHRVVPTFEAEAEEITSEDIIQKILDTVEVP